MPKWDIFCQTPTRKTESVPPMLLITCYDAQMGHFLFGEAKRGHFTKVEDTSLIKALLTRVKCPLKNKNG